MCKGCWEEAGSPTIMNEKVQEAIELARIVYDTNGAGGGLHIVLDDFNIEDSDIEWCLEEGIRDNDNTDAETERDLAQLLLTMTLEERASAIYHRKQR